MSDFNEKDKNITNSQEPKTWSAEDNAGYMQEDMTEEDIYRMIKEDAADIEPPESLSPEAIEKKLIGVVQESPKRRTPWLAIAGMAACLAFGVMAGLFTYSLIRSRDIDAAPKAEMPDTVAEAPTADGTDSATPGSDNEAAAELSYADVCDIINEYNESVRAQRDMNKGEIDYVEEASSDAAPTSDESAPAAQSENSKSESASESTQTYGESATSDDYSETDKQVEGVSEGDIVKTDGKHIFTIEPSTFGYKIHVIEPNGNESKEIGSVIVQNSDCEEIYIVGDRLFAIGNEWSGSDTDINRFGGYGLGKYYGRYREKTRTITTVVDISDAHDPKIETRHIQSGSFATSRISDGYLYVFTEDWYEKEEKYDVDRPEEFVPTSDEKVFDTGCIVRCGEDATNNYMVMTSLSVADPGEITDRLAVLGGRATYYVSTENIYIARPNNANSPYWQTAADVTTISKFRYNDGKIKKVADTSFRGWINDSYYMHEYQGNFCFVYTSRGRSGATTNGLCVMDGELKPLGEIDKIAVGETIYASYYIDNMAYFVTYRNTDPVFAVDISDPKHPELKSELKLPGFSSYLHSFGDDKLIGIGYGDPSKDGSGWDNTAKLSLFEIGKDYSIEELSKLFGEKEERHIADENHRAVFVDEKRGLIGLGLMGTYADDEVAWGGHYVVYQLKGNKLVKVMDTLKDKSIDPKTIEPFFTRGVRIGETFYVCDLEGVKTAYTIGENGEKWKKA